MKIGVFTAILQHMSTRDAFKYLSSLGVEQVEIGTGGVNFTGHLDPATHLSDDNKIDEFKSLLKEFNLEISALSCHGNPVHPIKEIADNHHNGFVATCKLAQKLGVKTIVTFSGCPGDQMGGQTPNWITCTWPPEFLDTLDWQWEHVLIPYWKKATEIAKSYGVNHIALEMHPGFSVYNPETVWRLREGVGNDIIGANFDPSHLVWQGMDPVVALKELSGAVYHFHAKDTKIDSALTAKNGVLDTKKLNRFSERSWNFRTIGYGLDESIWKDLMSTLRLIGYDGPVSIEHEDGLMSAKEGLETAVSFLQNIIISEKPGEAFWA